MIDLIKKLTRSRLFQNLFFWAVSFFVLLRLFTRTDETRLIDVIYTFLFHIPMVVAVTINSFLLIPRYLQKGMYWTYAFMFIPLYGVTWTLYQLTFNVLSDLLFPGFYFVALYNMIEIFGVMFIYVGITSLLEFSKSWFKEQETKTKLAELEKEKTDNELKALRAQINPHFLFNSLNTIYGEALKKSEKAPKLILRLSDMLRYVVEKMDYEKVSLTEEIHYLSNYVSLQKERLNNPEKVTFATHGDFGGLKIAPLLLIIFIENCFKHGDLSDKNGYITIDLTAEKKLFSMFLENTAREKAGIVEEASGFGIHNAKRRLELVYPELYDLQIHQSDSFYKTTLNIHLD